MLDDDIAVNIFVVVKVHSGIPVIVEAFEKKERC